VDGNINNSHGFYAREVLIYDKNHGIKVDAQFLLSHCIMPIVVEKQMN